MKVVSLVPSISELIWDLNLQNELFGITKFCIHPNEMFRTVKRIGGTKTIDIKSICDISPDLIIANKEENVKEQIEALSKNFKVEITDVNSVEEALQMILRIGELTNRKNKSIDLLQAIKNQFELINKSKAKRVIYLIWNDPFMAVGKNTFIDSMLTAAGFENCVTESRYPVVSLDEMVKSYPDFIFLSTEPFPFTESHKVLFKGIDENKIHIVDGEMFSWYGSRMLHAPDYFMKLRKAIL